MTCDQVREAISADLDGEGPALPTSAIQAHLEGCAACRTWRERAHAVTRRARFGGHVLDHDLTAAVLAAGGPSDRVRSWSGARRAGLVAVALAQFAITVPLLVLGHDHDAGAHAAHELGSFDLALAIAFAVGAIRPALSAGLAWPSGIAAAGLAVTALADVIGGQTFGADEAQHLIAVAGAALLFWQAFAGRTEHAAAALVTLPDRSDGTPLTLLPSTELSGEPPRYDPGPAAAGTAAVRCENEEAVA
jgi:predicted anti-sigma-YlaC factor YlaD